MSLLDVTFGRHFWTLLLDVTFGRYFWTSLLDVRFGRHFWTLLLDVTFGHYFWTSLLDVTFGRHFWTSLLTSLLDITFGKTAFMFKPLGHPVTEFLKATIMQSYNCAKYLRICANLRLLNASQEKRAQMLYI